MRLLTATGLAHTRAGQLVACGTVEVEPGELAGVDYRVVLHLEPARGEPGSGAPPGVEVAGIEVHRRPGGPEVTPQAVQYLHLSDTVAEVLTALPAYSPADGVLVVDMPTGRIGRAVAAPDLGEVFPGPVTLRPRERPRKPRLTADRMAEAAVAWLAEPEGSTLRERDRAAAEVVACKEGTIRCWRSRDRKRWEQAKRAAPRKRRSG